MWYGRQRQDGDRHGFFGSTGWLFADLMLALVAAFLIANTIGQPAPPPEPPKPSPTPTLRSPSPSPSPTPPPRLATEPIHVEVRIDYRGLLDDNPGAIAAAQQAVRDQAAALLAGKRAGLVLTFGAAPANQIGTGVAVANKFNVAVLQAQGQWFRDSAYRGYFTGGELGVVELDVFVFQ